MVAKSLFCVLALALVGCADSSARSGGGPVTASQTMNNVSIGGSNTNSSTGGPAGTATGGTSSTNVPVNLALDPSSFASIFGAGASMVKAPSAAAVSQVKQEAAASGDTATQNAAGACLVDLAKCIVTAKQ
jgi:hypothetical protein